jgi:hypothetical protein
VLASVLLFTVAAVGASLTAGARHDYVHFLEQWDHTMSGGDPWDQGLHGENPGYGPLFNAFAPLARWFPLLPKLLFTAAWLATAIALGRLYRAEPRSRHLAPVVLAYFALAPYFWIEIALYGHFDILPAATTLAALHLTLRERPKVGAGVLALGALLKTTPVIALPFMLTARPRRWRGILLAFVGAVVAVLLVSYFIWGPSTLTAVLLPARQESDLFSIFRFARGRYSPARLFTDTPDLDAASLPLVIVAGLLLVLALGRARAHLVLATIVTFIVVFALFKLGHPQFQMVVFVLAPYLLLTMPERIRHDRVLLVGLGAYLGWFSLLDLVYVLGGRLREPPWLELRELLGLPTFALALAVAVLLWRYRNQPVVVPPSVRPRSWPRSRIRRIFGAS